jgi:CubicO group peptidase (beta-lactamase class C family)
MKKTIFLRWVFVGLVLCAFARCSKGGGSTGGSSTGGGTTPPPSGGGGNTGGTTVVTQKDVAPVDNAVTKFMATWSVPGMSVAVIHNDKLIYLKSYGRMSAADTTSIKNTSLFRLASVSKQITSVAIMKLIEAGKLTLDTRVFGPSSIFGSDYTGKHVKELADITIGQLLHHTTGNWPNDGTDPMFLQPGYTQTQLINWVTDNYPDRGLRGQYYYSNFGYCLLGRVIEKLSGQSYEQYCKDVVLTPSGITDMSIGGNTLADRKVNEVTYNGQGEDPYNMNVARMDSHGGWLATAKDMARFLAHVDGYSGGVADILLPATIVTMTTGSAGNPNYACGWAVNSANNWWHNGSLPGTMTEIIRANNGFCWVMLCNTRALNNQMDTDLDNLLWPAVNDGGTQWQDIDQF